MRIFKRKDSGLDKELGKLEQTLDFLLYPVPPRPTFIKTLKAKLLSDEQQQEPSRLPFKISDALLITGGVVGSILMVIASIRGILSLISVLSPKMQNINKNSQKQQPSAA